MQVIYKIFAFCVFKFKHGHYRCSRAGAGPAAAACAADVPRTYLGARHDPHPAGSWDARRRSIPPLPQAQKLISMRRGVRASDLLLLVD